MIVLQMMVAKNMRSRSMNIPVIFTASTHLKIDSAYVT